MNQVINTGKTRDIIANVGVRYKILPCLNAEIKYRFENQLLTSANYNNDSSYYSRNAINNFTQVDPVTGGLSYPIPVGGISLLSNTEVVSNQGRGQLNFNKRWQSKHELTAIAGFEIRSIVTTGNGSILYGYDPNFSLSNTSLNYNTPYPTYGTPEQGTLATRAEYPL